MATWVLPIGFENAGARPSDQGIVWIVSRCKGRIAVGQSLATKTVWTSLIWSCFSPASPCSYLEVGNVNGDAVELMLQVLKDIGNAL